MAEGLDFGADLDPAGIDAMDRALNVVVPVPHPFEGVLPEVRNRRIRREFWEIVDPMDRFEDDDFRSRFRFWKDTVRRVIFPLVANLLEKETDRGHPVPPMLKLLAALRSYATASFQSVTADLMGLSQPTVSRCVADVSTILAGHAATFVKFPTGDGLVELKDDFAHMGTIGERDGILGVIGASDGTHIPIERPQGVEHPEVFRNRKGVFSINVQAVCGADMKFYDVVARWPGSEHDSLIFAASSLRVRLEEGQLDGILVGDKGYRCHRFLVTPVRDPATITEERYNLSHERERNVVERSFWKLKRRFPCLRKPLALKLATSARVVVACFVLHNIGIQENDDADFEVDNANANDDEPPAPGEEDAAEGLPFRQALIARHFSW